MTSFTAGDSTVDTDVDTGVIVVIDTDVLGHYRVCIASVSTVCIAAVSNIETSVSNIDEQDSVLAPKSGQRSLQKQIGQRPGA